GPRRELRQAGVPRLPRARRRACGGPRLAVPRLPRARREADRGPLRLPLPRHLLRLPVRLRSGRGRGLAGRGPARHGDGGSDRARRRRVQLPARRGAPQAPLDRPAAPDRPRRRLAADDAVARHRPRGPRGGRAATARPALPRDGMRSHLKRFLYRSGLLTLAALARRRRGGPPPWVAAVRALVLGARGSELEVPGLPPIALGPAGQRGPAARALTRALVPLAAGERAERLAAAAAAAGVDVALALAGVMLGWAQVRELAAAGWTVGAHTVTHPNLALAAPAEAEAEIAGSRDAIAAALGERPLHFAYPNSGGEHRYL